MRVLVDMDEVLAQFVEAMLARWNAENGTSFTRSQINMWQMEKTLGAHSLLWFPKVMSEPDFFADLEPVHGAIEGFNKLLDGGHDVMIVTMVSGDVKNAMDGKREWVSRYLPRFPMKNLTFCARKEWIQADALIDDAAHNIQPWVDAGHCGPILFDAPWNQDCRVGARVRSWKEALACIKLLDDRLTLSHARAEYGVYE